MQQQRFCETVSWIRRTARSVATAGARARMYPCGLKGATCRERTRNVDTRRLIRVGVKRSNNGPLSLGGSTRRHPSPSTNKHCLEHTESARRSRRGSLEGAEGKVGRIFWRAPDV